MCLSSKLKIPTQVPNDKETPSFNVIFFDVKFDVIVVDVKSLSMFSF